MTSANDEDAGTAGVKESRTRTFANDEDAGTAGVKESRT
jgi:hypothetical protein